MEVEGGSCVVKIPLGKEGFVDKALRQMMQAVQALLRAVPSVFRGNCL